MTDKERADLYERMYMDLSAQIREILEDLRGEHEPDRQPLRDLFEVVEHEDGRWDFYV